MAEAVALVPARRLRAPGAAPAAHLCNVYPAWYPVEGPPLGAGLIHDAAAAHLALFLRDHLAAIDCPRAIVAVDALFHTKPPQNHDETLEYTRPDILAYRRAAHLEPAGAFHLANDGPPDLVMEILSRSTWTKDVGIGGTAADKMRHYRRIGVREYWVYNPERLYPDLGLDLFRGFRLQGARYKDIQPSDGYWPSAVLGTRWTVGDTQRTVRNVPYRLLRLCQPGSADWYPTAEEKDAASARKDGVIEDQAATIGEQAATIGEQDATIEEQATMIEEQDTELQALRDWLEARDIDPEAILRARKTDA